MLHEWGFAIDDDSIPVDERMVWISSGESTGPKSKTFGIISALAGGKPIPVGTKLTIETHLIGRAALVDVRENDRGYLDIFAVTPMPKGMAKGKAESKAESKSEPSPEPAATDDLPF